jgi:aspartate/methionine/tyrosine aminotransferase
MVDQEHLVPKSKTRDLLAVWSEFGSLAMKYNGTNFTQGAPSLAPPQFLLDNLGEVVKVPAFNQYCPVIGHPELRNAIAKWWKPYFNGREINPNTEVLVTNGAIGSIFSIIMNMCNPGDNVHMFEPYFAQYINHIEFAGASCVTSPMKTDDKGEWSFDFDHFEKSLNEKSRLLILNNPHNPTGKVYTEEDMARISAILEKFPNVTVIADEVYFFLPFDGRKNLSFANYSEANWKKTINVYSAGKMFNATGWKIGWSIGPAKLIQQAFYVHEASVFVNNVPGQVAVARSME